MVPSVEDLFLYTHFFEIFGFNRFSGRDSAQVRIQRNHVSLWGIDMSEYKLTSKIIELSCSDNWAEAKSEWILIDIRKEERSSTCLCGHYPIHEICFLRNIKNNKVAIVGSCCVKKFMGMPSDVIFRSIKRVENNIESSLNEKTIQQAHKSGLITEWEHKFYINTCGNRKLTHGQRAKRIQINRKLLSLIHRAGDQEGCKVQ